jgi:hypothetical protein
VSQGPIKYSITARQVPATGDLRQLCGGDQVYVHSSALARTDWPRVWEALGVAVQRGADVYIHQEVSAWT